MDTVRLAWPSRRSQSYLSIPNGGLSGFGTRRIAPREVAATVYRKVANEAQAKRQLEELSKVENNVGASQEEAQQAEQTSPPKETELGLPKKDRSEAVAAATDAGEEEGNRKRERVVASQSKSGGVGEEDEQEDGAPHKKKPRSVFQSEKHTTLKTVVQPQQQ